VITEIRQLSTGHVFDSRLNLCFCYFLHYRIHECVFCFNLELEDGNQLWSGKYSFCLMSCCLLLWSARVPYAPG
jgi:hypothetical protein